MGHYFAQNSTLNPVGLNIYDKTKCVKCDQEINIFNIFLESKIQAKVKLLYDLWTDRVEGSMDVNPLSEVSPTFYENQQVFSSLDRWAYHPTHGRPITISQILSNVFLWFERNISESIKIYIS